MIFDPVTITMGAVGAAAVKKILNSKKEKRDKKRKDRITAEVHHCLDMLEKIGEHKERILDTTLLFIRLVCCVHHRYYRYVQLAGEDVESFENMQNRYNIFRQILYVVCKPTFNVTDERKVKSQMLAVNSCTWKLFQKYTNFNDVKSRDVRADILTIILSMGKKQNFVPSVSKRRSFEECISTAVSRLTDDQYEELIKRFVFVNHCCDEWLGRIVTLEAQVRTVLSTLKGLEGTNARPKLLVSNRTVPLQKDELLTLKNMAKNISTYDYRNFSEEIKQNLLNVEAMLKKIYPELQASLEYEIAKKRQNRARRITAIHQKRK